MKVLIVASALVLLCLTHVTTATNDLDEVIDDGDFDLDFGDDEVSVAVREELEKQLEDRQISCSCSGSSCSCCADIKIGKLNLNDAVCLRVTRSGTQVTLVVKVGRRTIYSKTISLGQSLPGPCIKFGGGKLCLKFTNVSLNPLRACARLDAKFWIFKLGSFKLGCFRV